MKLPIHLAFDPVDTDLWSCLLKAGGGMMVLFWAVCRKEIDYSAGVCSFDLRAFEQ